MESKPWYQSTTILASLVAAIAFGVNLFFHKQITPVDQDTLVNAVSSIATIGGSLWAIYGRIRATTTISA